MSHRATNPAGLIEYAVLVKADFISTILGSQPSTDVAADYVRSRAVERITADLEKSGTGKTKAKQLAEAQVASEAEMTDEERDEEPVQVTVFNRDNIGLHVMDYQVKGFLNEAGKVLDIKVPGKTVATRSGRTDLKTNVWVFPAEISHSRRIYFERDGEIVTEADEIVSRPKRVTNPRTGQEVSTISASEVLYPEWPEDDPKPLSINFVIAVLKSSGIKVDQIEELIAYGHFMGLSQWRTGGHGRFTSTLRDYDPSNIRLSDFVKAMSAA